MKLVNVTNASDKIGQIIDVKMQRLTDTAVVPTYSHTTDACADIYAYEDVVIAPGATHCVSTGLAFAMPDGFVIHVYARSGLSVKTPLRLANSVGIIDAGYRDEICVIIDNIDSFIRYADINVENGTLLNPKFGSSYTIGKGEKFAQLVLSEVPKACFYTVQSVDDIENDGRAGGFGSTGLK
jgi:dUTP pyrophosphatase